MSCSRTQHGYPSGARTPDFSIRRPVYIESYACVVKDAVKCSFEYISVVHYTRCSV